MDFGDEYSGAREIGRGGSSTVYRARSTTFDRDVAVKVFHDRLDDERLRRSFARECAVLGRLGDHPHIVSVFDSGFTADRRPYLVLTYCDGGSLLDGPGAALPVEQVVAVGIAVADALQIAHGQGIVHRDVKPHNVLRDRYGVVLLADFGISVRTPADLTSSAATPAYAAPEVLLDHRAASPASDVYGLGATLYNLLTGCPPCPRRPGEPDASYALRVAGTAVVPLPAAVPAPVARVVHQALSHDPTERPSAAEFLTLLAGAAAEVGLAVPARLPVGTAPGGQGTPDPGAADREAADPGAADPGTAVRETDPAGPGSATDVLGSDTFGAETRRSGAGQKGAGGAGARDGARDGGARDGGARDGGARDEGAGGRARADGPGPEAVRRMRKGLAAAAAVVAVVAVVGGAGYAFGRGGLHAATAGSHPDGGVPSSTPARPSASTAQPSSSPPRPSPSAAQTRPGTLPATRPATPGGTSAAPNIAPATVVRTVTSAPPAPPAPAPASSSPKPASTTTFDWTSVTGQWSSGRGTCTVQVEWGRNPDGTKVPYATKVSSTIEVLSSSIQYEHRNGDSARIEILHWNLAATLGFGPSRYSGAVNGNAATQVEALVYGGAQAYCAVWIS
jgi:Protein kinase domain